MAGDISVNPGPINSPSYTLLSFMTCSQRRVYLRYLIKTSEVCWLTKTTSAGFWTIFTKYKFYHSVRHIYQLMMNLKHKLMVILLLTNQENQPRAVELGSWVLFLSIYQKHLTLLVTRAFLISCRLMGLTIRSFIVLQIICFLERN